MFKFDAPFSYLMNIITKTLTVSFLSIYVDPRRCNCCFCQHTLVCVFARFPFSPGQECFLLCWLVGKSLVSPLVIQLLSSSSSSVGDMGKEGERLHKTPPPPPPSFLPWPKTKRSKQVVDLPSLPPSLSNGRRVPYTRTGGRFAGP